MRSQVIALTAALVGYAAAAPYIVARQDNSNPTETGVAALESGIVETLSSQSTSEERPDSNDDSNAIPNADLNDEDNAVPNADLDDEDNAVPDADSNADSTSTGGTFTIPAPIAVPSDVQAELDAANADLARKVDAEVTNVQRFNKLLTVDGAGEELLSGADLKERVVFNFNTAPDQGEGGRFKLANVNAFPILAQQGISTAVGFLKPCSMNSPHTHPRATEWLTVVQGNLSSGYIIENGFVDPEGAALASEVAFNIGPFEGAVFPQGSIHYQFNDNCEPATFIATLNSEDPGTSQAAQNLFFLDDGVVDVALGGGVQINGDSIEKFRGNIPANLVQAMEGCMNTCGYN